MIDRWVYFIWILFYFILCLWGLFREEDPTQLIVLLVTNRAWFVIPRTSQNSKSIVYVNQTVNHSASSKYPKSKYICISLHFKLAVIKLYVYGKWSFSLISANGLSPWLLPRLEEKDWIQHNDIQLVIMTSTSDWQTMSSQPDSNSLKTPLTSLGLSRHSLSSLQLPASCDSCKNETAMIKSSNWVSPRLGFDRDQPSWWW